MALGGIVTYRDNFKTEKVYKGFFEMHFKAQEVCLYMIEEAKKLGVKAPMVTETVTNGQEDKALGRVSQSHSTKRAWDFRTWNMTTYQREELMKRTRAKYGHLGAFNKAGVRCLLVYHNSGHGDHIHCQLDSTFAL